MGIYKRINWRYSGKDQSIVIFVTFKFRKQQASQVRENLFLAVTCLWVATAPGWLCFITLPLKESSSNCGNALNSLVSKSSSKMEKALLFTCILHSCSSVKCCLLIHTCKLSCIRCQSNNGLVHWGYDDSYKPWCCATVYRMLALLVYTGVKSVYQYIKSRTVVSLCRRGRHNSLGQHRSACNHFRTTLTCTRSALLTQWSCWNVPLVLFSGAKLSHWCQFFAASLSLAFC